MSEEIKRNPKLPAKDPRVIFIESYPELTLKIIRGEVSEMGDVKDFIFKRKTMQAKTAKKIQELTGTSAAFWLKTQLDYELYILEDE